MKITQNLLKRIVKMSNILKVFLIAVCFQLQLSSVKGQGEFVPKVPSDCQALGFCDQPIQGYPTAAVEKIIKDNNLKSPGIVDVTKQESRRQNPKEVNLCDFNKRTILPQVAKDTSGQWNYIVNSQQSFSQGFQVEICKNADSQCSNTAHFPAGYTASCQQRFISRVMTALDASGKKVTKEFTIPSNCYCQVLQP